MMNEKKGEWLNADVVLYWESLTKIFFQSTTERIPLKFFLHKANGSFKYMIMFVGSSHLLCTQKNLLGSFPVFLAQDLVLYTYDLYSVLRQNT